MSATKHFKREYMPCAPNTPQLNVPVMIKPLLDNYNAHVENFVRFLKDRLNCYLVYQGPDDIHEHILRKTVYSCSVYFKPKKILKDVFPIMIGSRLDLAIRHHSDRIFKEPPPVYTFNPFQLLDIGCGFFIINGFLRQIPYFYTNDPTNTHIIQKRIVRVYSYNSQDRGKELSLYVSDPKRPSGQVVVVHNDGRESSDDPHFFEHCPFPVDLTAYMYALHREDTFDIDHLGNKIVVSPGHLFVKLFIKYLYGPLQEQDWKVVKSRLAIVNKSIETGCFLHVLSRKTMYFKEGKSVGKMTSQPQESHREIGVNGEVFVEKNTGCYREVNSQTYPLNPYLQHMIVLQMSQKVKHSSVSAFHPSYLGFICILGCFETKNVGRTSMMVRDTAVSTGNALDPVYDSGQNQEFWKALRILPSPASKYFVVVNEASIPVTRTSFERLDLLQLKRRFQHIECYMRGSKFIVIRYKIGLIMKKLPTTDIWVTPNDEMYWARIIFGLPDKKAIVEKWDYDYITSYLVDLNPFFRHNAFPKNILAFNSLKNAVLATTPIYALYFMDPLSAYYRGPTEHHDILLPPADDFSRQFVLRLPRVLISYMSFKGSTQEDCIVRRKDLTCFDCYRFYTVRFKLEFSSWIKFYPVRGESDDDLLGTVVSGERMEVEPYSIHTRAVRVSPQGFHLHFAKAPFRVLQHVISQNILTVSVENEHISNTGDKLCSLHGQKGVMRVMKNVPTLDGIQPDLLVNPFCLFRMTMGQILEGYHWGEGKDATCVRNSEGKVIEGSKAYYGKTFYFNVAYWSSEHKYAPETCVQDKVIGQPVKGRSRGGGMRLGNQELMNGLRGNGIASCFEEKFLEDGDRVSHNMATLSEEDPTLAIPKSVILVKQDSRCYKFDIQYETKPSITELFD